MRHWTDPLEALRWIESEARSEPASRWIGYLGYDLGRWFERLPSRAIDDLHLPLFAFAKFSDHDCPASSIVAAGECPRADARACTRGYEDNLPRSTFTRDQYLRAVSRVIEYIRAGDVFQANLAQRFTAALTDRPVEIYQRLLASTPAWYGGFLDFGDFALLSNSPELFLRVSPDPATGSRKVVTRPIKGTRPRIDGMDRELLGSAKDQAELNMIVDLERNDLGRVCEIGSVRVTEPRTIEAHPTVYHGSATIEGILRDDVTLIDLLRATFPGGSVTGAPKIRAMQIIDELEPVRRGPYCGAIGYISADRVEFNVAIRTMIVRGPQVHIPVGGGIVADSDPQQEYEETLVKARAMFAALNPAHGGFTIRPARPDDAEAICRMHVQSIRALCASHYSAEQIEAWAGPKKPDDYRDALQCGEVMYVAVAGEQVLGFASRAGDEIKGLYVAPFAVRRGIGSALLSRMEADALASGLIVLRLHSTLNAIPFYRSRGYVAGEPARRLMHGVEIPCIPMSKPLSGHG